MKIVFLTDYLPSKGHPGGGLQNYISRVALGLHSRGDEIWVVCKSKNMDYKQYPFEVKEIKISYIEKKILKFLQFLTFHKLDDTLQNLFEAWAIRNECNKIPGVEVVQSPNYQFMGLFVKSKEDKLIVRASSYRPVWDNEVPDNLDKKGSAYLENKLYKRANSVFAPSFHLAKILDTALGIKVDVVPTPIPQLITEGNRDWFEKNLNGKKYILHFGTMLKRKGIFILAKALNFVWKKFPDVIIVMIGPDFAINKNSNFEKFLEDISPNKNKVIYQPALSHASLFPVIKNASFVVLPSIEDNCPNSMLEAMALGQPVIGTIGSSMDEFYPPSCSNLLVPRNDSQMLGEKIVALWNCSQVQLDYYGTECREYIEQKHNLSTSSAALRSLYEQRSVIN